MKEWVLYTSDPEATKRRMGAFGPTVNTHQLQMVIREDRNWDVYRQLAAT